MEQQGNKFKFINGYIKGMNKDLSLDAYNNEQYLHSEWLSPITGRKEETGNMINPKGTIEKISLPSNEKKIGIAKFRDYDIIISVDTEGNTSIYKFKDDNTLDVQTPVNDNFKLLYSEIGIKDDYNKFGYTQDTKLSIVTRYETDLIQKFYFAAEGHPLRYMNIVEDASYNDYSNYTQSDFNIIPVADLDVPTITGLGSGNLKAGKVGYAYQQYKRFGAETSFSAISKLQSLSSTIAQTNLENILGDDVGENTGLGVNIEISNLDTNYSGLRILAFHYNDFDSDPEIRIIYEGEVTSDSFSMTDTGQTFGVYSISDFRIFNQFFIQPKYLTTKNNILFPANMQEIYFDLDTYLINSLLRYNQEILSTDADGNQFWDSRSYRGNTVGEYNTVDESGFNLYMFENTFSDGSIINTSGGGTIGTSFTVNIDLSDHTPDDIVSVDSIDLTDVNLIVQFTEDSGLYEYTLINEGSTLVLSSYSYDSATKILTATITTPEDMINGVEIVAGEAGTIKKPSVELDLAILKVLKGSNITSFPFSTYIAGTWDVTSIDLSTSYLEIVLTDGTIINLTDLSVDSFNYDREESELTFLIESVEGIPSTYDLESITIKGLIFNVILETTQDIVYENSYLDYLKLYKLNLSYTKTTEQVVSSANVVIYNKAGDALVVDNDYNNVPKNHDCINIYNKVSENGKYGPGGISEDSAARLDKDGNVGGSGKNVSLKFATRTSSNDESRWGNTLDGGLPHDWKDTSWQRDEIYRTSIQFRDYLGRHSYPKWIMDVRMPNHDDPEYNSINTGAFVYCNLSVDPDPTDYVPNTLMYTRTLYPQFKVVNVPKNPDGTYMDWRILKVKREGYNQTVLGTALVAPIIEKDENSATRMFPFIMATDRDYTYGGWRDPNGDVPFDTDKTILEIISPEVIMEDMNINNTIIQVVGNLDTWAPNKFYYRRGGVDNVWTPNDGSYVFNAPKHQMVHKLAIFRGAAYANTPSSDRRVKITEYKRTNPVPYDQATFNIGDEAVLNMTFFTKDTYDSWAEHGTCAVAKLNSEFNFNTADFGEGVNVYGRYMYALIKKDTIPYGGNSYAARLNNYYIPASDYFEGVGNSNADYNTCTKGDVRIGMFDYLRAQAPRDPIDLNLGAQDIMYIPMESKIDFTLRGDKSFSKIADGPFDTIFELREEGLAAVDSAIIYGELYQYNPAYSRENDTEVYKSLSTNNTSTYEYDHRIRRSEIKSNGEFSDSWLRFLSNNYLDVDSQFGEITQIMTFKDRLIYFQEHGFGTIPVGEKELIPSEGQSTLSLGSSGILNRYDYFSEEVGISNSEAVVKTLNSIYFIDKSRRTLYIYQGQNIPLSDIEGMNSWFDENIDDNTYVFGGYNPDQNQVIFTLDNGSDNKETIVYNELGKAFLYLFPEDFNDVSSYFTHDLKFYSFDNNANKAYKHGLGERGDLHEIKYPSKLTLVINPRNITTSVYDVLELFTEVYDDSGDELQETISSIRVYNEYQDTGVIPGDHKNIKRRFRVWRWNKIRDAIIRKARIRSKTVKVDITFTNTANKKLILHNLITNYSTSKMQH